MSSTIHTYFGDEVNNEISRKAWECYLEVFPNEGHYLVFPSSMRFMSPQEVFSTKAYVPFDDLMSLDEMPKDSTGKSAVFYHHPEITRKILHKRMTSPDSVTTILESSSGNVEGFVIAEVSDLRDLFQNHGWCNPLMYSGLERPEHCRSAEDILQQINSSLLRRATNNPGCLNRSEHPQQLELGAKVFAPNAIALRQSAKFGNSLQKMFHSFVTALDSSIQSLPFCYECRAGDGLHSISKRVGAHLVFGSLYNPHIKANKSESVIVTVTYNLFVKMMQIMNRANGINHRNRQPERPVTNSILVHQSSSHL